MPESPERGGPVHQIRKWQPSLSLAAVDRTLETFRGAGLIVESRLEDNRNFYAANAETDFHFICPCCRELRDLSPEEGLDLHREIKGWNRAIGGAESAWNFRGL